MSLPTPPPGPGGSGLPARRLSTQDLEAVIRRAVELQSGPDADDGITEAETIRIGKELGLSPELVRRAIADVRGLAPAETGVLASTMGAGTVRATRMVRKPAVAAGLFLEQYLTQCEFMVVQRRFQDRTRYVRASGIAAQLGRAASRMGARHPGLKTRQIDVGVSVMEEDTCLVEVSVDLSAPRAGMLATGAVMGLGGGAGAGAAAVVAFGLAPPLVLLGLPVVAAGLLMSKAAYGVLRRTTQDELEGFLDRLEHGELKLPQGGPEWRRRLGI